MTIVVHAGDGPGARDGGPNARFATGRAVGRSPEHDGPDPADRAGGERREPCRVRSIRARPCSTPCASTSASPAPRRAATAASAAPARCWSTGGGRTAACCWPRRPPGGTSRRSRASRATSCTRCSSAFVAPRRLPVRLLHARPDLLGDRHARRGRRRLAQRGAAATSTAAAAARRGRGPRADERQPVPLRRVRQHRAGDPRRRAPVKAFDYQRPDTLERGRSTCSARPRTVLLGGGTNLVDLMKIGVSAPDVLVDVSHLPLDADRTHRATGRCVPAPTARNSELAAHPAVRARFPVLAQALLAGASGQLRNSATTAGNLLQRTRCPYFMDAAKPCNKREPGTGCPARDGVHRMHAVLGGSEHCIATHPSDMAVALAALDTEVVVAGPDGERRARARRVLRPARRHAARRDDAAAGRDHHRGRGRAPLPAGTRSGYRKVRDRASYAFAVVSVAAALTVADGAVADVRIAFGGARPETVAGADGRGRAARRSGQPRGVRRRPRRRTRGGRHPAAERVQGAAAAPAGRLGAGRPDGGGAGMTILEPEAIGTPLPRTESAEKVTGRGAVRLRVRGRERRVRLGRRFDRRPRRRAVRRRRGGPPRAGVVDVVWHANAPALAEVSDAELRVLQSDEVVYYGQPVAVIVAETLEAAALGRSAPDRVGRGPAARLAAARRRPAVVHPEGAQRRVPVRHLRRRCRGGAGRGRVLGRRRLRDAAPAQRADGTARLDRACGSTSRR